MAAEVVVEIVGKDSFSGVLGNFGSIMTGIKSTIDLVAGAFNGLVSFGSQFTNSAIESQNAIAELEQVLKATEGAAGLTSQELQNMANHLQNVTMFSDETIMAGQSMLLTFRNIGEDTFPRATEAMLDMAQMFGSVDSAAVQLGKALNDPIAGIGALSRIGIQFTEEQKEMIKNFMEMGDIAGAQNIILKEVEMQIGGLAKAMGDTAAGQWEIFKNKIDEVKEGIGGLILHGLTPLLETLNGDTSIGIAITTISNALGTLNDYLDKGVPLFQALGFVIAELPNHTDLFAELPPVLREVADALFDMQAVLDNGGSMWDALTLGADRLSQIIGDAVSEAFAQIDWNGIVEGMDNKLAEIIESHDWGISGQSFGRMIENQFKSWLESDEINGPNSDAVVALGNAISEWFLGAMNMPDWETAGYTFIEIIKQFVFQPIGDWIKDNWISILLPAIPTDAARAKMQPIVDGIKQGFIDGMNSIEIGMTDWVRDHIVDPVKAFLGISSPSTVFAQIGRDIIGGLISGFNGMVGTLINTVTGIVNDILSVFAPVLEVLGIDTGTMGGTGGTHAPAGGGTGTTGTGTGTGAPAPAGSGTVINQYFSGATINVGSWDEIAYDCIYPNPFVAATSGQLAVPGGGGGGGRR